ncbi:MAG: hypothetical protein M1814_005818 [Vezdaea aestivalis]|nr:MAG: hypothetical protein M1814_005818 [Vezdaea aestivalis]
MDRLSNELISSILDQIAADPEKVINIDKRAYLSVESFRAPEPPVPDQAQVISHFRLTCKRFAELGIRHQFTKITTRFSKKGFERLNLIAGQPHLSKHVKKFSYMLPFFYVEGRANIDGFFLEYRHELPNIDPGHYKSKAADQWEIIRSKIDRRALDRAFAAFTSLQHVQILRFQDEADRILLDCIRDNHETAPALVDLKWTPACIHGTGTVGKALLFAQSPFSRFSGPMMSPQYAMPNSDPSTSVLAARLTCLELHFDDGFNLDTRIRELTPLFKTVFEAATGMQHLHIGFPSRAPLSLRLEEIFHNVRWRHLRAFGIQAWKLSSSEIIALAQRHKKTLRGLRLRDVLLTEESLWKDVLDSLREEMEELRWVSLRRIGYASFFEDNAAGAMEIGDWIASDESDVEDGFTDQFSSSDSPGDDESDDADDDTASEGDEHGPLAYQLAILSTDATSSLAAPDTPTSAPWCTCSSKNREGWCNTLTKDDLGDDGRLVSVEQRKRWEQWVVGRCAEHGRGSAAYGPEA